MEQEIPKQYSPHDVEERIYQTWEKSGFFNPDNLPERHKKPFTIAIPPPNITGSLHLGHALNATIQDILIRKKRMEGYRTLWLPGTDHAGIATQNVVEKQLKKEGLSRHTLGKEKFIERIWQWKEQYGNTILEQLKKLGASCDWSRTRFTMDDNYQKAVKEAFLHYHKKGWLYKAEKVINWCARCATSLSDLELEYKEINSKLYYINYPIKDSKNYITVATTRPETMLGDTAVAVNPTDERYKNVVGKILILPIHHREIPVITDEKVEKEFGTGAVKVTPAHDLLDAEIGERHKLPVIKVIGPDGKMTAEAKKICEGTKVSECREKVIEELKKEGALEKEEGYMHNIAVCYRCETPIETIPSLQWFLKMDELAKKAIDTVKNGDIIFHPKRWENVYFGWLNNIRDWTISRQIWWGHKIPIKGEEDVLDTWFSSALWPFATLGWPFDFALGKPKKGSDLEIFYPTAMLSTARDIINLWVARMIFSGAEFMGKKPFNEVIIHATILTKDGKRMSKSLGTGIDPMGLIEKYGSDATRFGLIWQAMGSQDIHWSEEHVLAGRKFLNKIWNASRFILMATDKIVKTYDHRKKNPTEADKALIQYLGSMQKTVNKHVDKYEFGHALHELYDFFWHEFCDIYLETAKKQLQDDEQKENTKELLSYALSTSLKLLHPFIPHITEHIWGLLPHKDKKLLIIEEWEDKTH
ncbi:MAG: valine--tRNA ligase [Candidatus Niyogibacteria bacterium]|nr:valine--tRNA ligase [Candidatus Niyogibacteria bacterium]